MDLFIKTLAAAVGTVAFSLLFGVPGRYYPFCGLIGGAFLWVMVAAFVLMIAAPTVYSYLLFKGKIK